MPPRTNPIRYEPFPQRRCGLLVMHHGLRVMDLWAGMEEDFPQRSKRRIESRHYFRSDTAWAPFILMDAWDQGCYNDYKYNKSNDYC